MAERNEGHSGSPARGGLAGLGIAGLAVICCAAFPLLAAVAGGVALGTVLGVGAGVVAAVLLVGAVVLRTRRRPACETPAAPDSPRNDAAPRPPTHQHFRAKAK